MQPTVLLETERYVLLAFGAERIITDKRTERDYVEFSPYTGEDFERALCWACLEATQP